MTINVIFAVKYFCEFCGLLLNHEISPPQNSAFLLPHGAVCKCEVIENARFGKIFHCENKPVYDMMNVRICKGY